MLRPDRYECKVTITKTGNYRIVYNGIVTHASLYSEIVRGKLSKEEAKSRIDGFEEQLKPDSAFKTVNSLGKARYQVRYEREGVFCGAHQMLTFVSRQGPIFRVRTFEDGRISVSGSGAGYQYAGRFEDIGLNTEGLFRVQTDAKVIKHNAGFLRETTAAGFTIYEWRIRSFRDSVPRIFTRMTVDPAIGGPLRADKTAPSDADDEIDFDALAREKLGK